MKRFLLVSAVLMCFSLSGTAQTLHHIRMWPPQPRANDTLYLFSDFSFLGNCSYGLIEFYTSLTDTTLFAMPLFCGYGDSTPCRSIDTLKIAPLAAGRYRLKLEYHQGSICPYSGFDATLLQYDSVFQVGFAASQLELRQPNIRIYPNPASETLFIGHENTSSVGVLRIMVRNSLGQVVHQAVLDESSIQIDLSGWPKNSLYVVSLYDQHHNTLAVERVLVH